MDDELPAKALEPTWLREKKQDKLAEGARRSVLEANRVVLEANRVVLEASGGIPETSGPDPTENRAYMPDR